MKRLVSHAQVLSKLFVERSRIVMELGDEEFNQVSLSLARLSEMLYLYASIPSSDQCAFTRSFATRGAHGRGCSNGTVFVTGREKEEMIASWCEVKEGYCSLHTISRRSSEELVECKRTSSSESERPFPRK